MYLFDSMMADEELRVKEEVDDTLDRCGGVVIGKDHPKTMFLLD